MENGREQHDDVQGDLDGVAYNGRHVISKLYYVDDAMYRAISPGQ